MTEVIQTFEQFLLSSGLKRSTSKFEIAGIRNLNVALEGNPIGTLWYALSQPEN